ncbi:peptidoglycan editing factor PgeF [Novosphingobium sp. 9U]|uniref:peptidoglycan editing factor PgeF n=1 Tax=Novosphingobium sp. 9U TaxID=2653158 RepID=UPI0012F25022|nr:peptidoglycan editing factor PgeF [Novosphingobium sp. 9U]VWX53804.1 Polyphenol oxidase [Novosphingobium sp. 9U]
MTDVLAIHSPLLGDAHHGFLGRIGGVSQGVVAGLNVGLGSGDDPVHVAENRRRAVAAVAPGAQLATAYQVHSAQCVAVTEPWPDDERPHADALVTDRPGVALGILTADCAPVLFADPQARVVGAAHAGWKGAIGGVTDATIAAMEALGAQRSRIAAVVGPCIAQISYEVDAAFRQRFLDQDMAHARFFVPGAAERWQFDLEGYVVQRLRQAGLAHVAGLGLDTYAAPDRFYSFRRATHRSEPSYGRQIALIALP